MKTEIGDKIINLPDFVIVGAEKSGTTSLNYYLSQHPQVFMPVEKMPTLFNLSGKPEKNHPREAPQLWRLEDYVRIFENARDGQVAGEISNASLFEHERAIETIKRYYHRWRDLKIIMVLRNPIERAFSNYIMVRNWGEEKRSFEEAIKPEGGETSEYIKKGMYYEKVRDFLENFDHVKVYLFDDLKTDTADLVRDLYRFLGVDDSFSPDVRPKLNPSGEPWSKLFHMVMATPGHFSSKLPLLKALPLKTRIALTSKLLSLNIKKRSEMRVDTRKQLKELYREDILKLQELIGRDLSAWLEQT